MLELLYNWKYGLISCATYCRLNNYNMCCIYAEQVRILFAIKNLSYIHRELQCYECKYEKMIGSK